MSLIALYDTICALSTPSGKSAIAVMRITGAEAIKIAAKSLSDPFKLFAARGGESFYTDVIDENKNHIDDVIVGVFRAPHSYTGEDLVEIHTHGSTLIIDLLQNLLSASGARLAEAGEFSRRAYMNGKITLEELELLSLRIDASSERSLSKAETIIAKKFSRLKNIYDSIISLLAQINAEIDFGESDHVEIDGFEEKISAAKNSLNELVAEASNRSANKGFYSVALTGPPNVGKSSLFNALLKYERSIVSDIPGTTRDYLEAFIILDGFRVKLIDTAGLREASEEIESRGIELGKSAVEEADLTLRITDPDSRNVTPASNEILIHNKCDIDHYQKDISLSARTGEGLDTLIKYLKEKLLSFDSQFSSYQISQSERSTINNVLNLLEKISAAKGKEISLLAEDLRTAADSIATLVGYNISVDSLDYIFSKMCIGK